MSKKTLLNLAFMLFAAVPSLACGGPSGQPQETQPGESQTAVTMGQTWGVARTITTSGTPRRITFQITSPYPPPIYPGVLTLTENTGITGYSGTLVVGSSGHPSVSGIQVGTAQFSILYTFVGSHTNLDLDIQYDDTSLVVSDIELSTF